MIINKATEADLSAIIALLKANNLPVDDIKQGKQQFLIAQKDEQTVGCIGIEIFGKDAILRSLAVDEKWRNKKIANCLYQKLLDDCWGNGITRLFLLTNTAQGYFERLGWAIAKRSEVPAAVAASAEFAHLCPSTAVCMELSLLPFWAQKTFESGFNCAQASFTAFAVQNGIDRDAALSMTTGFGSGMVGRGETCGAITGSMLAIGLQAGRDKVDDIDARETTNAMIKELYKQFTDKHGSILCKELLELKDTSPESWQQVRDSNLFKTRCPHFVADAVAIAEGIILNNKQICKC
jgi:C_GCAxxG_C_C family probable redox protein